jgi:glycosyltransferase involved in cell wall biosynthesis
MVAIVNVVFPSKLPRSKFRFQFNQKISILVPARNEEQNLPRLLDSILSQDYENFEVLIYDDQSTDKTPEIVQEYSQNDGRIKLIHGIPLPEGWMGKNHACHRLGQEANGDFFFFMDADVHVGNGIFQQVADYMAVHKIQLLSIFPKQEIESPGEWMTVPLMNWILLSLLPIPLSNITKRPSLSAANGQFMVFNKENYMKYKWHEKHKKEWVEDITIMRSVRTESYKTALFLGRENLSCRMYKGYREAVAGFTRNLAHFYVNNYLLLLLSNFLIVTGVFFVWSSLPFFATIIYIAGLILLKIMTSIAASQSILKNLLFQPLQILSLLQISIQSYLRSRKKQLSWKGRQLFS